MPRKLPGRIEKLTLLIVGSVSAIIVILIYLGSVLLKDKISLPKISLGPKVSQRAVSDVLFLTSPVNSINGKIDRISGDTIWVSQEAILVTSTAIAAPAPTPVVKNLTFRIKIPEGTTINKIPASIPYLFRETTEGTGPATPGALSVSLDISELTAGQYVNITSTTDLRVTDPDQVTALFVTVTPGVNSVGGQITAVSGNTIMLRAFVPTSAAFPAPIIGRDSPVEKELTITIDSDSEISQSVPTANPTQPRTNRRLSISDLRTDMTVTVYTDVDISSTSQFTAKLIQLSSASVVVPPPPAGELLSPPAP